MTARRKATLEFLRVMDGQEHELPVGGEAFFQNDGRAFRHPWRDVPVGVGPKEIAEWLKGDHASCFQKGRSSGQAVDLPDEGEDQSGDGGEELLVMSKKDSK